MVSVSAIHIENHNKMQNTDVLLDMQEHGVPLRRKSERKRMPAKRTMDLDQTPTPRKPARKQKRVVAKEKDVATAAIANEDNNQQEAHMPVQEPVLDSTNNKNEQHIEEEPEQDDDDKATKKKSNKRVKQDTTNSSLFPWLQFETARVKGNDFETFDHRPPLPGYSLVTNNHFFTLNCKKLALSAGYDIYTLRTWDGLSRRQCREYGPRKLGIFVPTSVYDAVKAKKMHQDQAKARREANRLAKGGKSDFALKMEKMRTNFEENSMQEFDDDDDDDADTDCPRCRRGWMCYEHSIY